jgi:NADP-reducing hydrogenase subunit HndD
MINLTINNKQIHVEENTTIIEAARLNGINIPSLCKLNEVCNFGTCRMCVVEVERAKTLQAACVTMAQEGMVVKTNTTQVQKMRKVLYELLLSDHKQQCLSCSRNLTCELQALGKTLGISESRFNNNNSHRKSETTVSITRDMDKCILCRRCISVCNDIQGVGILQAQNRGFDTQISIAHPMNLAESDCIYCGQCTLVCPVGALMETDAITIVKQALSNPNIHTVVQVAPAVRVAIGEEFGYPAGTVVTGKLFSALRDLGFNDVFDTNFAADLTIIEEGTEFLSRIKNAMTNNQNNLPMITSCSPGWIKFCEHNFPEHLHLLSTCKSPHMMLGALVKSYYAKKINVDPKNMFVVSIMPCTAKKFEISRDELMSDEMVNVDAVLTTRELAAMIKESGIEFSMLLDSDVDNPLGFSSGAADIFGVTGGVMEAALRTAYELITAREFPFEQLRLKSIEGFAPIKEAEITINNPIPEFSFLEGQTLKVAVASGAKNADKLMKQVAEGTSPYHFIEIMGCPGGCINGGGQPRWKDPTTPQKRLEGLFAEDHRKSIRKSHQNEFITELYEAFLTHPNSHVAHHYLHTHYVKRGKFNEYIPDCNIFNEHTNR